MKEKRHRKNLENPQLICYKQTPKGWTLSAAAGRRRSDTNQLWSLFKNDEREREREKQSSLFQMITTKNIDF